MTREALELIAYRTAAGTQQPIALPPLPNGVVVVITPQGGQRNFASADYARLAYPAIVIPNPLSPANT
jgi:hypothetical protein